MPQMKYRFTGKVDPIHKTAKLQKLVRGWLETIFAWYEEDAYAFDATREECVTLLEHARWAREQPSYSGAEFSDYNEGQLISAINAIDAIGSEKHGKQHKKLLCILKIRIAAFPFS